MYIYASPSSSRFPILSKPCFHATSTCQILLKYRLPNTKVHNIELSGSLNPGIFIKFQISPLVGPKRQRSYLCIFLPTMFLLSASFFIVNASIIKDYKERFSRWGMLDVIHNTRSKICENQCRPYGSEVLPKGIVSRTSNLEMRPLWGPPVKKKTKTSMNLLAIAVGIKQKENVNKIVKKFPSNDFVVMLFHYDGIVDKWRDLEWSDCAVHVSAINQTKWWFAKRFLHPDIVSEYAYIFLWDEDIGVEYFHVERYLSIIKEERLEISQPALDPGKSEVHHQLTARDRRSKVHRRIYKLSGRGRRCDENSTDPPCTGWVEMMAPVFSRASWRCTWYMIQNDLIHAWGLDFQLGYCAQGDRTKNIGIVDSEYIVHYGLPTLGGSAANEKNSEAPYQVAQNVTLPNLDHLAPTVSPQHTGRDAVRRQSFIELEIFKNRWKKAAKEDECWIDPTQQQAKQSNG